MRDVHDFDKDSPATMFQQLLFVMGANHVRRYHTVPLLKDDTVASHSFGVAWLCYLLAEGTPSVHLLMAALSHDLPEQVWGDVPSPAKRMLGLNDTVNGLEEKTLRQYHCYFELSQSEKRILSMADCFEGMLRCVLERRMGNKTVDNHFRRYADYLSEIGCLSDNEIAVFKSVQELWRESLG